MMLDACVNACAAAKETFGPIAVELLGFVALGGLGWWKARKVQAAAQVGINAAHERASKAKAEAQETKLQLAELKGSLRPAASFSLAPTLPPLKLGGTRESESLEGTTSASGTYQPVQWPPMPDGVPTPKPVRASAPDLEEPVIPRPSAVPREGTTFVEMDTQPETPTAKKRERS